MHEFSLIEALLEEVDRVLAGRKARRVTEIGVVCGPLSGVDPSLLTFAFDCLVPDRFGPECRLTVDSIPLQVKCNGCGIAFSPATIHFWCPSCGDGNTEILQGGDFLLSRITFEDDSLVPTASGEGGADA